MAGPYLKLPPPLPSPPLPLLIFVCYLIQTCPASMHIFAARTRRCLCVNIF